MDAHILKGYFRTLHMHELWKSRHKREDK